MIQSPTDKVIITITSKYTKDFGDLVRKLSIQDATSVHIEDFSQITGTVVSLPKELSKDSIGKGFSMDEIRVGDTIIFAFNVVFDFYQKVHEGENIYRNKISYNAKDYWLADIKKIFGIIRDGEVIMINGFVMAKTFEEDVLFTQPEYKKIKRSKKSELIHICKPRTNLKPISVETGQDIFFNPKKVQKYQINNKPFIILTQQQVLGKVN